MSIYQANLKPAQCYLDLSDGSERGEYVHQDYILRTLHRPHRAINLMYCYYPLDRTWPSRARDAFSDQELSSQWDYPYDDYFPYLGGIEGNTKGQPFEQMRDVRRHGEEVCLTLTTDPGISDQQIMAIAHDLRSFGRIELRLNHEATGEWFTFNKRYSYQEVADFFVHFKNIMKEHAPNVTMILCIGGIEDPDPRRKLPNADENSPMAKEEEFKNAVQATDIWSVDKYMSLHWGWPCDRADVTTYNYNRVNPLRVYELCRLSYERYSKLCNGETKPFVMSEFNADGDVVGPYDQVDMVKQFFQCIKKDTKRWFSGITFYQFRDKGRLGLEIEDPSNKNVGIPQPILSYYKELLQDPFFSPSIETGNEVTLPVTLRYGGSQDAEGLSIPVALENKPVFFEAEFTGTLEPLNLMIELNGHWFYKAPGVTFVDFMPFFFENEDVTHGNMNLTIFAPPATGENPKTDREDWDINYYETIKELPSIRIEYAPVLDPVTTNEISVNWS